MWTEAAAAGLYAPESLLGREYPRLQILTISDLLAGKHLDYPRYAPAATFKKAPPPAQGPGPGGKTRASFTSRTPGCRVRRFTF